MPPRRTSVREFVYYEYAKLITQAAKGPRPEATAGKKPRAAWWGFVACTYRKLQDGTIHPSNVARENKLLVKADNACAYCGATEGLQWDHIIPKSRGGPDTIDNLVLACGPCNAEKGARDPIEWCRPMRRLVPRVVMGKFLKLVLARNAEAGTLDDPLPHHDDGRRNWIAAFEN